MSGQHYISVPKRRMIGHAAAVYLSPDDVEEFRNAILDAGLGLGALLTVEYPRAEPVSETLYVVTTVVGIFGMEGKWVTLWASSDQSEFLATAEVREVSTRATIFDAACMSCVVK